MLQGSMWYGHSASEEGHLCGIIQQLTRHVGKAHAEHGKAANGDVEGSWHWHVQFVVVGVEALCSDAGGEPRSIGSLAVARIFLKL